MDSGVVETQPEKKITEIRRAPRTKEEDFILYV
jgi:hypothetical protein